MCRAIKKDFSEYMESANTPDLSPSEWYVNPDLSNVTGQPQRYWKAGTVSDLSGKFAGYETVEVELMSTSERDAVDTARAANELENRRSQYDAEELIIAMAKTIVDLHNLRHPGDAITYAQFRTALRNHIT